MAASLLTNFDFKIKSASMEYFITVSFARIILTIFFSDQCTANPIKDTYLRQSAPTFHLPRPPRPRPSLPYVKFYYIMLVKEASVGKFTKKIQELIVKLSRRIGLCLYFTVTVGLGLYVKYHVFRPRPTPRLQC